MVSAAGEGAGGAPLCEGLGEGEAVAQQAQGGSDLQVQAARGLLEAASPGLDSPSLRSRLLFEGLCHWQHSSPSSNPLDWPSPSESSRQSSSVYLWLKRPKAVPYLLRAPPPVGSRWPMASTPALQGRGRDAMR